MACGAFRNAGLLIVAVALTGILALGSAGSLPAEPGAELEGEVREDGLEQETGADVTIDILDTPPRYADGTTGAPASVVTSGQSVQWQWEGGQSHSVTSDPSLSVGDEPFDSGIQRLDGNNDPYTFEVTFSEPGVYKVFCQVHPLQHGLVVVV